MGEGLKTSAEEGQDGAAMALPRQRRHHVRHREARAEQQHPGVGV